MTSWNDQAGSGSYAYDPLGRISTEQRTITPGAGFAAVTKNLSYAYNLDSSIATLTYPSGAVITYTPDSAGRMLSAVDQANSVNYVTGATYDPASSVIGFVSGNTITNSVSYNNRLQPTSMSATSGAQTVFGLEYNFHWGAGDNGNVWSIANTRDTSRNQTFSYDALNRLISAQNAGADCSQNTLNGKTRYWSSSYGYDAWGNLINKTPTKCSAENLNAAALVNNQLSGYGYDAAGNMTHDATTGNNYSYDQENRISGAAGFTYTYDDDENRVEKSNGSTGTIYWYMAPGIVAESDLSGNLQSEYLFFDGERVARKDFSGSTTSVSYYFSDFLKTASVITDAAGNIKEDEDYYPWGGELQFLNNDSNHYKFTGKERDAETGLDYFGARHYSNWLGRFLTPDWAAKPITVPYAHFGDPQSLNLYGYVRNIPTSLIDGDGHGWWSDALDFSTGVVRGIASSVSYGTVGAPKSSDSTASLVGQAIGTAIEGAAGTITRNAGKGLVVGGLVAEGPSLGTSTAAVGVGVGGVVAGGAMELGAAKNGVAIAHAMANKSGTAGGDRAGKSFTRKDKGEIKAENAAANAGQTTCEKCGQPTVPAQQSKAGVTPPANETHIDHIIPKSQNGDGSNQMARYFAALAI